VRRSKSYAAEADRGGFRLNFAYWVYFYSHYLFFPSADLDHDDRHPLRARDYDDHHYLPAWDARVWWRLSLRY
jgi:hypothetical protein